MKFTMMQGILVFVLITSLEQGMYAYSHSTVGGRALGSLGMACTSRTYMYKEIENWLTA